MANSKCRWDCPELWSEWSEWLGAGLHARNRWRLPVLLVGILFANGRRTVTTWLRAAGVSDDYQDLQNLPGYLRSGRRRASRSTRERGSWLVCFFLHRSGCQRSRDSGSVCRSCYHRTRLSRREGGMGFGPTASTQHLDQPGRIQFESLDAYASGTLGMGQKWTAIGRPGRLALGRCRATSFARQSPQSPAWADHAKGIVDDHHRVVAAPKNSPTGRKPHEVSRLS